MQLAKWFAVPTIVLAVAVTLAIMNLFDITWVAIAFAASALATLYFWRRASYKLSGSIKNIDHEKLGAHGQRMFKTIFAITFAMSFSLMLAALIVLIAFPSVRTPSGVGMALTLMAWCSIVKFSAMNVLTHHLMPESRPT